jgi:hypothetical protein
MNSNRNGHQNPGLYFVIDQRGRQVGKPLTCARKARAKAARLGTRFTAINAEARVLA